MAVRLGWDYHRTQAQPVGFVEELLCYWDAANGLKNEQASQASFAQWVAAKRPEHDAMIAKYFRIRA